MLATRRLSSTVAHAAVRGRKRDILGLTRWKSNGRKSKAENNGEKKEFSWKQVLLQWALGVYVSTPFIAILQGSLILNDYRVNYSDAPHPLMPARGVTVAVDENASKSKRPLSSWILHPFSSSNQSAGNERPLRLLVVGDSLAAGVGMSKSGVPILPESIARALSKALGGRAVYWTCVGTAGSSALQIVRDIKEIEPYDPHPKGRQLERIVKEFQIRRRRWQERHLGTEEEDHDNNKKEESVNPFVQWWRQVKQTEGINSDEIIGTTRRVVNEWWMQSSLRKSYRYRSELVKEDISVIKEIVLQPLPQLDDDDDEYYFDYFRENFPIEDDKHPNKKYSSHETQKRFPLLSKGSLFRRPTINPEAAAEYDVAVVLTGLNDVKEVFLPHMNIGGAEGGQNLESRLREVLGALEDKMRGNIDLEGTRDEKQQNDPSTGESAEPTNQAKATRHPLIVVPELPVAPLELFRLVPLCWFLVPIFRAMENNKRYLASCFPDNVVFVHQPDLQWWTDDEMGIGSIRENIQEEQLLLRVTDTVRSGRERIEEMMKNFYDSKEEEQSSSTSQSRDASDFVSADRMHPNDEGYELYGRHIAAAIIDHWNKDAERQEGDKNNRENL